MGALLSSKASRGTAGSRPQITDNDRALLQIKVSKTRLVKRREGLVRTIEREAAAARQATALGDRVCARDALRRRRYWELTLERTGAMMEQLDAVLAGIELAQLNKVVYDGLRGGTAALKQMQLELSEFEAERLMEERADALALQDAVDSVLGTAPDSDPELEQQLERLEAEALASQLPSAPQFQAAGDTPSGVSLPSPPQMADTALLSQSPNEDELARGAAMTA